MEVRTILWPTDLSKNSLKATKHVVSLAEKYQAQVIMLYVGVDLMSFFPAYGSYPSEDHLHHFQNWEVDQAKKRMETVCDRDLKACPNLQIRLVQGDAASEILKAIDQEKADMVIMTTHGRGHEDIDQISPAFGSVAEKVIRNSPVPVHLINPFRE
ncbi:MAG: universal stress protein [Desulfobacca sp.]|nr:universal stress protein [Desulfobacca sp.]